MIDASPSTDPRDLRAAATGALAARFPARWLEEHAVLPLREEEDNIAVATGGPIAQIVEDSLVRVFSKPVRAVLFAAADIRAALISADRRPTAMQDDDSAPGDALSGGDAVEALDDLRALASREPVVQVVNAMLAEALRAGASDVHVESTAAGLRIRFRLDGVLHDAQQLGRPFQAAVLSRLKVLAGLDIAERRQPQDGRARLRIGDREVDVRVSTLPALHGEGMVLRLLDHGEGTRTLTTLGVADDTRARFNQLLARSSGLVLVTGPTGSGKTTTLYAALAARNEPGVKVVTVEDPVEYRLDGITQLPVNPKAGFGFPTALRAILRHDPDVILVGEMRDLETAEIAVQAALTGHLVLSTLHTTDASSAVTRLTEMGIAPYLVAATVQGVLAQRLVRTLCDACATWSAPTNEERALLAASNATVLQVKHAVGCERCAHTGYRGRVVIAELLMLSDAMRALIVNGAPLGTLRTAARAEGFRSLRDDGWRLVRAGGTTVDEVVRVVSEDEGR